eukprot:1799117-Ditylum_brightwellii.AAC.1
MGYMQQVQKERTLCQQMSSEGGSNYKGHNSNNNNKFILLTNKYCGVNKNCLLLDNQLSTNIMCNRKYVTNICKVKKTLTLNYFEHSTKANYMCDVSGYGTS